MLKVERDRNSRGVVQSKEAEMKKTNKLIMNS